MCETGELTLRAYAAETRRIEAAMESYLKPAGRQRIFPALRHLLTASSLQDGWRNADHMDKREVVRLLHDVTIKRATVRDRSFDPRRMRSGGSGLGKASAHLILHQPPMVLARARSRKSRTDSSGFLRHDVHLGRRQPGGAE